jgi:hypothetical protein
MLLRDGAVDEMRSYAGDLHLTSLAAFGFGAAQPRCAEG